MLEVYLDDVVPGSLWNTSEFRLDGTKINGENNTEQRSAIL